MATFIKFYNTPPCRGYAINFLNFGTMQTVPSAITQKLQQYAPYIIFVLAITLYIKTVVNDYCIDDFLVTKNHPMVAKGIAGIPEIFTSRYLEEENAVGEYRPFTRAVYAIEYEFFGFNPHVSHFFNALLYGFSCVLLYKFFIALFGMQYFHAILVATLLFVAHPAHSEVVISLKNRENIFSFLLPLIGLKMLLQYFSNQKIKFLALAYLFYTLGLTAKTDALEFAYIAALVTYYSTGNIKKSLLIMITQAAIVFLMNIYKDIVLPDEFIPNDYVENPLFATHTLQDTISLSAATLKFYLQLMLLPNKLLFYYGYNMVPMYPLSHIQVWGIYLLHIVIGIISVIGLYKRKIWATGIMWYLGAIAFFSQIIEPVTGVVGERHAYIASAGFALAVGYLLFAFYNFLLKKNEKTTLVALYGTLAIIVVFWSNKVIARIPAWETENILFDTDMPHLKNSVHGNYIYGINLKERAESNNDKNSYNSYMQKATQAFKQAVSVHPHSAKLWYSSALSYNAIDSATTGIAHMKKAFALDSTYRSVNYFMAMFTLNETQDTTRAIQLLENEMLLRKENLKALSLLVSLYKQKKLTTKAFNFFSLLVTKNPKNYETYLTLANIYLSRKDTTQYNYYYKIAAEKSQNTLPEFFY
jgi:hypothetical protein